SNPAPMAPLDGVPAASVPSSAAPSTPAAAPSSPGTRPVPSGFDELPNSGPGATSTAPALERTSDGGVAGTSGSAQDQSGASGGAAGDDGAPAEPALTPDPEVDEAGCPAALLGWGAVAGDGVQTTTGGGESAPVRPTSASELTAYASDPMPRVIEIEGSFEV